MSQHNVRRIQSVDGNDVGIVTRPCQSIADLEEIDLSTLSDGDSVVVKSFYSNLDDGGGTFIWDAGGNENTHNGGTIIAPSKLSEHTGTAVASTWWDVPASPSTGVWKRVYTGDIDIRWFGATGSGDETIPLEKACAVLSGGRVLIPYPSFTVGETSSGPDCNDCVIVGSNTTITGDLRNTSYQTGILVAGKLIDSRGMHPTVPEDSTPKMLYRNETNEYYLYVKKPTTGYALIQLVNNVTTPNNSLATSISDITMWRVNGALDCVDVVVGRIDSSNTSGSWTAISLITGIPVYDSGRAYNYQRSTTIGAWYEITLTVPDDGYLPITFLRSGSASTDVTVAIDGTDIDANFSTNSVTAELHTRIYRVDPGSRVVRITNNTAGSTGLQIVGCNFQRLKDVRVDLEIDQSGHYRNSANIDPLDSSSANDYAIWDEDASLWGGSYHGGESSITTVFAGDGATINLSNGEESVANDIRIKQTCTIDWSVSGGATISIDATLRAVLGGFSNTFSWTGALRTSIFYTTLMGLNENFNSIHFPEKKTLSTITDGDRYSLGKNNHVEYRYDSGDNHASVTHSTFNNEENKYGGAFIWRVVGFYNKYYYSPVDRGDRTIDALSALTLFKMW